MPTTKKPLSQQVVVITGASSGIGLATAQAAATQGAAVVLVSRNEDKLRTITDRLARNGGKVSYKVADVADKAQLERVVEEVEREHGRIDTWVNNAGVSAYGRLLEISRDDHAKIMHTNFWGVVNGSEAAMPALRRSRGTLVNLGSALSDRAVGMQGMYSASKHAIKGYTDALRMELMRDGIPVDVSLIKPGAINTPYTRHAKNYTGKRLSLPSPVYDPSVVAAGILHCAKSPIAHLTIGGGGKLISALGNRFPGLMDIFMVRGGAIDQQFLDEPTRDGGNALHSPMEDDSPSADGDYSGMVKSHSVFTNLRKHPVLASTLIGAAGAGLFFGLKKLLSDDDRNDGGGGDGFYGSGPRGGNARGRARGQMPSLNTQHPRTIPVRVPEGAMAGGRVENSPLGGTDRLGQNRR